MPWYEKAMKDATTCEKPWVGGNNLRSMGIRMGQPIQSNVCRTIAEYIGYAWPTRGSETSQYPEEEKTIVISRVVASEKETV